MISMKRHHSLEASGIRKLVAESRGMETTDAVLTSTMTAMEKLVMERFSKGKKLDGGRLQNLLKSCDAIFRDRIRPIRYHSETLPATKVHPKGDAYEVCYVGVKRLAADLANYDELYQLFSFRLHVTRKSVSISLESLPYAFQYHAAERLMERAENVDTAFWQIASDLAEWSTMLKKSEYFARRHNEGSMSVPIMGTAGILIGEFAPRATSPSDRKVVIDGIGLRLCRLSVREGSQSHMFVGKTFIGRFVMRPNQAYSMKLLTDWRAAHSETYCPTVSDTVWERRHLTPQAVLSGEAVSALVSILDNPILRRSLHPDHLVNRIVQSDWDLPLGEWAHDRYRVGQDAEPSAIAA